LLNYMQGNKPDRLAAAAPCKRRFAVFEIV
jgi:hypothetical protein